MKIVCDTNVWYELEENKILLEAVRHLPLAPTFINIKEIASNKVFGKDFARQKRIFSVISEFESNLFGFAPFIHFARLNGLMLDHPIFGIPNVPNLFLQPGFNLVGKEHEYQEHCLSDRQPNVEITVSANEHVKAIREQYGENNHIVQPDYCDAFRRFMTKGIGYTTGTEIIQEDLDWSKIQLMQDTWEAYDKFILTGHPRSTPYYRNNDWSDLFNLIYVQPENKYWSLEKPTKGWKKIIYESELAEYLYEVDT